MKSKSNIAAEQMPGGLKHITPNEPFDIRKSEVVKWLVSQPAIMQAVFDRAKESGSIVFDPKSQTWAGKDFSSRKQEAGE